MCGYMPTTIAITEETRDAIQMLGHKGETYDSILQRLVDIAKMYQFYEQQKLILTHEKFHKADSL